MTELYNTLTKPELIMGLIVLLGGIFMALQKLGLVAISFRRDGNGKCPDPGCSALVGVQNLEPLRESVDDLKVEFKTFKKEIFNRMDKDSRRISYISGSLGIKED